MKYDPPLSISEIENKYPQIAKKLLNDPVHRWRAETGIELIHKEPTLKELKRIWRNWGLMTKEQKSISNRRSLELFGLSNESNYKRLLIVKQKVYLAGQPNQYDDWRSGFKKLKGFDFYDPDADSDQSSPETFFPQDLVAVRNADILVANPGTKPSEATWIEIGYFLAINTKKPGDTCKKMIIIWTDERLPKWSIEFVKKAGKVVNTVDEAIVELQRLV